MTDFGDPIHNSMRSVYEALGFAFFQAQAFESGVAYLIALAATQDQENGYGETQEASLKRNSKLTLGALLKALERSLPMQMEDQETLRLALSLRNKLTHHWLQDHIAQLGTESGRQMAVDRLESLSEGISIAQSVLNGYIDRFLRHHGWSTETLKKEAERAWELLNDGQSERLLH
jgi:hypothetical protein